MSNIIKFLLDETLRVVGLKLIRRERWHYYRVSSEPTSLDLCTKYGLKINSVIHVGANLGQEAKVYFKHRVNVAWFIEAHYETFLSLKLALRKFPSFKAINVAIADYHGRANFFIASNDSQSSSLLKPGKHLNVFPHILFNQTTEVEVTTLDSLTLHSDLIVIDVQGAELSVLKGGVKTIAYAKAIILECNIGNLYVGDCTLDDIIEFLKSKFTLVYVNMSNNYIGDAFFVRNDLLNLQVDS